MAYGDTYRQVAEPDWRGLRQMEQEDAMQEQVHQAARMKNFQDRGILPDPNAEKIKLMQAKAQFDASNFEKRYTAKQKADLSQISAASTAIDNDPSFSDSEKMAAKKACQIKPGLRIKSPDRKSSFLFPTIYQTFAFCFPKVFLRHSRRGSLTQCPFL